VRAKELSSRMLGSWCGFQTLYSRGETHVMKLLLASVALSISTLTLLSSWFIVDAKANNDAAAIATITKIENDTVQADLANDAPFFERLLADDWTFGDSGGFWLTKSDLLKSFADRANTKTNVEKISDLKVRVYGNTAIATYRDTFDGVFDGEHRGGSVISTDTFVKIGSEWKEVASHSCPAK